MIRCRYPGRAGLLGEHCDWAGGASLAVPVPMGVTVVASEGADAVTCVSQIDGRTLQGEWAVAGTVDRDGDELRFVGAALAALTSRGMTVPPTTLRVTSDLPPGRGFSSSAAFTLGMADALAQRAGRTLSPPELAELAFHIEHDLLGVACGRLDQLACSARQPLFLRWEGGAAVEVRPVSPRGLFHLVVAAFSRPRDTGGILATLNRHFFADGDSGDARAVRDAVHTWGRMAVRGSAAIQRGDAEVLGDAMNRAQHAYDTHLEKRLPALRSPGLRAACDQLTGMGALGAKFSGAGGDGSVVALFADATAARSALDALGRRDDLAAWYCPVGTGAGSREPGAA